MRARDGLEQQRQRMRGKIIAAMDGERRPGGKNTYLWRGGSTT